MLSDSVLAQNPGMCQLPFGGCWGGRGCRWVTAPGGRSCHCPLLSLQPENTKPDGTFQVTMLPGDGVGPELMHAVKEVFKVRAAPGGTGTGGAAAETAESLPLGCSAELQGSESPRALPFP